MRSPAGVSWSVPAGTGHGVAWLAFYGPDLRPSVHLSDSLFLSLSLPCASHGGLCDFSACILVALATIEQTDMRPVSVMTSKW